MSIGPSAVSGARSWIRQSFMLSSRTSPSSTTSAESPPGPSLIDVSTWMVTVRPSASSTGRGVPRADEALEAEAAQRALELVGRVAGQQHRRRPVDVLGEEGHVEVVGVEVGDVEEVGLLDRLAGTHAGSWSLRGNTNHEPKNAGTNHGSHTIEACVGLDQDPGVAERGGAHRPQAVGRSAPGQLARREAVMPRRALRGRAGR